MVYKYTITKIYIYHPKDTNKINTLLTAHRTRATKQSERNQTYLKYNRNRTRAELNQNI